jgi:heptosyltransferase III
MIDQQIIPKDLLQKSDRILFVTHLAIGDYLYLQNSFRVLSEQYPNLKIDLWIDELRRTRCFWRWPWLKNYALYNWVESCSFFNKIYRETYSPSVFKKSVELAQQENYSIVVSFGSVGSLKSDGYSKLARKISPRGFVVGMQDSRRWRCFSRLVRYQKLNGTLSYEKMDGSRLHHISDINAKLFEQLFGLKIKDENRAPFVSIPEKWITHGKLMFADSGPKIFINSFAKTKKRCWSLGKVAELIAAIKKKSTKYSFVVNAPPEKYLHVQQFFKGLGTEHVSVFTANENFFQLPALLSLCDLVISVETSVMHLSPALGVPVVALMRQKNPEWVPRDQQLCKIILTNKRSQWIESIDVNAVLSVVKEFL